MELKVEPADGGVGGIGRSREWSSEEWEGLKEEHGEVERK